MAQQVAVILGGRESGQIGAICCAVLESILRAPDPSEVQTAQEQDSDDEDATATLSNIKHSAADVRDWVVRVHGRTLLEVLHEAQRHQQEAMAGRATSALRLLIQEDTCSEEGRRLVEALQAHD